MQKSRIGRWPALAAFSLSLAAAGVAHAAMPSFDAVDRDGDGYISVTEASATPALVDVFASADANGDGLLSKEEYEAIEG